MTNNDSLIHQKFLTLTFCHKYQETSHPAFTCSKPTMETLEKYVEYVKLTAVKTTERGH